MKVLFLAVACLFVAAYPLQAASGNAPHPLRVQLESLNDEPGVAVILANGHPATLIEFVKSSELTLFVQSQNAQFTERLQRLADAEGLLGTRIYAEHGRPTHIPLANDLADCVLVTSDYPTDDTTIKKVRNECLRVLRPGGKLISPPDSKVVVKPRSDGVDDWSHPYHGPDNNPQSRDKTVKGPYLTKFLCEPWYVPMPQVTVTAGGRIFKAFGHIALKEREWPWLNSLVAINGYNGTHLWKRDLRPGFMVHRNNMVATRDVLYLADDKSCKLIDASNGEVRDEIVIDKETDEDGVWKWIALQDGLLYALVGKKELLDKVIRGDRKQAGWPWSGLGAAYGGKYAWGFGRTLLAIDPGSKRVVWKYRSSDPIDGRALCMAAGRIFAYSHQKYLAALDISSGTELWKTRDKELLDAIGAHDRAQTASKGFASSAYAKCNDKGIYFAGPQRTKLAGISAKDGSLMWQYPHGNFQLVLRDDALYAMGRMETSKKFDYLTGEILADLECYRGNCTRATATADSIFTRGYRHTGTMRLDLSGNRPRRIPLMRPACQDGVIVSHGHLFWGPWMCDCNHSLVGMISLAPARDFDFSASATNKERLDISADAKPVVARLFDEADWTGYRGGPARTSSTRATSSEKTQHTWTIQSAAKAELTAPVTAAGLVVWSGLDGVVRAADVETGELKWTSFTGGAVRFAPSLANGRAYVGSGDGYVYCFNAQTGQRLWRFRAAPADRRISVHGTLLSTWPVGSGVLVNEGVVYAAAGITSYDGTHVYALDAESGKIIWQNNSSGRLVSDGEVTGVSVQGHLLLHDDRLYLAGGNVVSPAMYEIKTGECLNELENEWWAKPADAKERFPSKPKSEMFKRSPRGRELFVVDGQVRVFDQLLYSPPKYGPSRYFGGNFLQVSSGDTVVRATTNRVVRLVPGKATDGKTVGLWQDESFADPLAMALCTNAVLVAGQAAGLDDEQEYRLTALRLESGQLVWSESLPAAPASWGLAVDRDGRAIVTLVDGRVVCFSPKD